jgi:dTDP-4-dehydrorhamnose reductase
MKILITGGSGRFCKELKKSFHGNNIYYQDKKEFNILDFKKILLKLKRLKIDTVIHTAGLSRPMKIHDMNISLSIDTNIIGTSNVVKACKKLNIKLIYFSTSYVYPCTKGNYKEDDCLKPVNNYALSKLGGECAVQMYKNSLILRITMTEFPFVHKRAFKNAKTNFIYHHQFAKILPKLLKYKGIINVGGEKKTVYNFAKKDNPKVLPIYLKKNDKFPRDSSMNIEKIKKIIKVKSLL